MNAHVLLNLLHKLKKSDKIYGIRGFFFRFRVEGGKGGHKKLKKL